MAIYVGDLRTDSMKRRRAKFGSVHPNNACELCCKIIKVGAERLVALDHERYEFVTETEARERGDSVSLFPIGADCEKRVKAALGATMETRP